MNMSYRRAWLLIDGLNQCFRLPAVETQLGRPGGAGAVLTDSGPDWIARSGAIERAPAKARAAGLGPLAAAQARPGVGEGRHRAPAPASSRRRSPLTPRRARG